MRQLVVVGLVTVLTVQMAAAAYAVYGDLDPTFSGDGVTTLDFAGAHDSAFDVLAEGQKSIAAGAAFTASRTEMAVAQYLDDGTLDESFGNGGKTTIATSVGDVSADEVLRLPNGHLALVGASDFSGRTAVGYVDASGSQVSSIGTGGVQLAYLEAAGAAADSLSRVVVASTGFDDTIRVERFSGAALDPSFGSDGQVATDVANGPDRAVDLEIDDQGRIVVLGVCSRNLGGGPTGSTDKDICLVRYLPSGALDETFDDDGRLTLDLGTDLDRGVALKLDGSQIVVVADVCCSPNSVVIANFTASGDLNTSFGGDGLVSKDGEPNVGFEPTDVVLDSSGGVVVSGWSGAVALGARTIRFHSTGDVDDDYGTRAFTYQTGGSLNRLNALALRGDGKLVAAGAVRTGTDDDFGVARLEGPGSSPPPPPPPDSESDATAQDTLVDVTAAPTEGVLNIEVSQEVVDFGSVQEGTSSSATSVGTLTYTNTLGASRSWDVTVAATDLVRGSNRIDFENLSFDAGNTITPAGATVPITGSTAFSGGDPDGFSAPHPLANAPSTAQGTFTHAGSTATLSVPFGTPAGNDYTGMLQYTITG